MKSPFYIAAVAIVLAGLSPLPSMARLQEHGKAVTDVNKAGEDYEVQGEYLGSTSDGSVTIGAQIIAKGNGKFEGRFYIGGLPGDGWDRSGEMIQAEGERSGDTVTIIRNDGEAGKAVIRDGVMAIYHEEGNQVMELQKKNRTSPTMGAKPPKDAVVLFDGKSAEQFENGKLVEGKYLAASNCKSKEKFADHHLHVEFRTPYMPEANGQARGNSGVYVQGRYEVQVLDSFGLDGKNNECGGVYSLDEPKVNMCLPPLTWQTYDIDFTAPKKDKDGKVVNGKITVKHNGVVIHDQVELTKGTPGGLPMGTEPESLFLQDHGNPVVFRNIWAVKK